MVVEDLARGWSWVCMVVGVSGTGNGLGLVVFGLCSFSLGIRSSCMEGSGLCCACLVLQLIQIKIHIYTYIYHVDAHVDRPEISKQYRSHLTRFP